MKKIIFITTLFGIAICNANQLNPLKKSSAAITNSKANILNAKVLPWGTVARYSGNKVYFTNSVWAALSEAINMSPRQCRGLQ